YDTNCFAKVNEKFLTQAVSNYISNAVKHSTENGNVYVRVINQEESVRIEVQNEGPNIPENKRNSIWDMFYQGNDNETLNGQKGSGLGLYLVRNIVELHNGKYGYSNLEKGVNFYIEIPKEK
ncbi:MAG: sensor histidine kinase, partial [Eubacterium sp.]